MNFSLSKDEILHGNLFKGLIKIALPLMFLNIINTLYGIVDTYFVGQIGEIEVGAVAFISPITACTTAITEGLCVAGIALIARKIGEGDNEKANEIAKHLLLICLILGIVANVLLLVFGKAILLWLNIPSELFKDAYNYLFGISFDFIFLFSISIYQAIRQAHGDSKSGVVLNTTAALLNCVLDPLFIFVFNMSTFGAAIATVLSKALVTPIALYRLAQDDIKISFKDRINYPLLKEIITIALPNSAGYFMSCFGFVLMSKEIAFYGASAVSGYGVGSKIASLYHVFINCWGSGLTTFVGTALGAKDITRAKSSFKTAMILVFITSLIFIPLGFLTSESLVRIFIKNVSDEVLAIGINYIYYSVFTAFCMGWFRNLEGLLNGSGNTLFTMVLEACRMWFVRIPLIKLLTSLTNLGPTNIWLAMCISNLIICSAGTIYYYCFKWYNKKIRI